MRYPITPEYIKTAPDILAGYYRDLEEFLLKDICERFRLADTATATSLEHIRLLQRRGYSYSYIKRKIKKLLGASEAEYRRIVGNAIEANQQYYSSVLREQKLVQAKFNSVAMRREVDAIVSASLGDLQNITRSMGFSVKVNGQRQFLPVAEAYQKVLSQAEINVWSGAQSYNEAIRDAVRQLTDSGLQVVTFANNGKVYRRDHVDVAVRRAVMTSITRIADQYSQAIAEEVPTEYWEITAHAGARDKDVKGRPWSNHKKWQGRVYSIREGDKYPSIYKVCGFGEVDGLEGINCRHMRYPFWDGISERTYTDEELANIDPPPFTFDGTTYSHYEATQRQRGLERNIRALRRDLVGFEAAGDEDGYQIAAIKYNRYMDEYRRFCKAGKLRTEDDRLYVQEFGPTNEKRAGKYTFSVDFSEENDIIRLPDVVIGKSVGAKSRNYDIDLPDGQVTHLTEGTRVTNVTVIAGKGRERKIDIIDLLLSKYPESKESEWMKVKGIGYVDYENESYLAELHWFEEKSVGRIRWKVKPDADGNWFIED